MRDDGPTADLPLGSTTPRLAFFSDGVFAIAITLIVLEIPLPADAESDLLGALADEWSSYLAYAVSFSTIGALWLGHTAITGQLGRVTSVFVRLNLLLLFFVAFLPYPTRLLTEYVGEDEAEKVSTTVYGLNLLVAWSLMSVLWRYAVRADLLDADAREQDVWLLTQRLTPGLGGYVALIALGIFLPVVAVVGYFAIALFFILPFGSIRLSPRRDRDRGASRNR